LPTPDDDRVGRWLDERIDPARGYREIWTDAVLAHLVDDACVSRAPRCRHACGQWGMPVAGPVKIRTAELNVDEVPLPRALVAFSGAVAIGAQYMSAAFTPGDFFIRAPRGCPGRPKHLEHLGEILLGNQRDDLFGMLLLPSSGY
jgi:hypothetical protein